MVRSNKAERSLQLADHDRPFITVDAARLFHSTLKFRKRTIYKLVVMQWNKTVASGVAPSNTARRCLPESCSGPNEHVESDSYWYPSIPTVLHMIHASPQKQHGCARRAIRRGLRLQ